MTEEPSRDEGIGNLSRLISGAVIIFSGKMLSRVFALIGQIAIIRSLPQSTFGEIALSLTIVSVLSGMLLLGTPNGTTRLIAAAESEVKRRNTLQSGYLIALTGAGIGIILILLLNGELARLLDKPGIRLPLLILTGYIFFVSVARISVAGLRGFKHSTATVISRDLVAQIVSIGLFVAFLWYGMPFWGAFVYYISTKAAAGLSAIVFLARSTSLPKLVSTRPNPTALRELIDFSWPLAFQGIFVILMTNLDVLMVGFFLPTNEVALYKAVQPLAQVGIVVLSSFVFLYMPIVTEHFEADEYETIDDIFKITTKWIVSASLPLIATFVFFAEDVVRIFYTATYTPAGIALVGLSIGMFIRIIAGPNGATIQAIDKTRVDLVASSLAVAVNFVSNLFLIPAYGIFGAAIGTTLGYVIFNVIELLIIYQVTGSHPFSLNTLKPLPITGGFAWFLSGRFTPTGVFGLVGLVLALTAVHIGVMFVTQSFDKGDIDLVRELGKKFDVDVDPIVRLLLKGT